MVGVRGALTKIFGLLQEKKDTRNGGSVGDVDAGHSNAANVASVFAQEYSAVIGSSEDFHFFSYV